MLVKLHIKENITLNELSFLKNDLNKKGIKIYKMYCPLPTKIIKLHLSNTDEENLKTILLAREKILDFKIV